MMMTDEVYRKVAPAGKDELQVERLIGNDKGLGWQRPSPEPPPPHALISAVLFAELPPLFPLDLPSTRSLICTIAFPEGSPMHAPR